MTTTTTDQEKYAPSQQQVLAELAARGSDDYAAVYDRLRAQNEAAAEKARRTPMAPPEPPWRIEPTDYEIEAEMFLRGFTLEDARASLREQLANDARRLAAAAPTAADEIAEAVSEADEARERADRLLEEKQAVLDGIQTQIFAFGSLQLKIRAIQSLQTDKTIASNLANRALEFFLAKQGTGESAFNVSSFDAITRDLMVRTALAPHIPEFLARLEIESEKIAAEIHDLAREHSVELRGFLKTILAEPSGSPALKNARLYDSLLS